MTLRRFHAASHKDAMREVREKLGDDAIIVTSRRKSSGTEIFAIAESALDSVDEDAAAATGEPDAAVAMTHQLLRDMQEMRALLHKQVQQEPPEDRRKWCYLRLRAGGYSDHLARDVSAILPGYLNQSDVTNAALENWLIKQLKARVGQQERDWGLLNHVGVIALVGPTGIGKTTTTAKLAAHYVMQRGADDLLLVTTDSYRVGAQQQLATYAELLGVEMVAVTEPENLSELRSKMSGKRLVLIDTVGMSQRDHRLAQRIAAFADTEIKDRLRLVLLLNAASQQTTLDEVANTYKRIAGELDLTLSDCILTKADESTSIGGVLDTVIRHQLVIQACSTGQSVPEDLIPGDTSAMINDSLNNEVGAELYPQSVPELPPQITNETVRLLHQGKIIKQSVNRMHDDVPDFPLLMEVFSEMTKGTMTREGLQCSVGERTYWSAAKTRQRWNHVLPNLALAGDGLPYAMPSLQSYSCDSLGQAKTQIFEDFPPIDKLDELTAQQVSWMVKLNRNHRFWSNDNQRLAAVNLLKRDGVALDTIQCFFHGEQRRIDINISAAKLGKNDHEPIYQLIHARSRTSGRNRRAVNRYFLVNGACTADEVYTFCQQLFSLDEYPRLTRIASGLVSDATVGVGKDVANEISLVVGAALSALAIRIEQMDGAAMQQLRTNLMAFDQRSGRVTAEKLVCALWRLLSAHQALLWVTKQAGSSNP